MALWKLVAGVGVAHVTILAGALLVGAAAPPQVQPLWVEKPTGADVEKAYTGHCYNTRVPYGGTAVMECRLLPNGRLADCAVVSEEPAHCEFGEAVLRLAPHFRTDGIQVNGKPIPPGSRVRLPFRFELPQ